MAQARLSRAITTTQGAAGKNYNNHPFAGKAGKLPFVLAHNGVLYNDLELQRTCRLSRTKVETDSYVAVQLIEREGELKAKSLKVMAEVLEGTFTFTVLDGKNNLYFVKGNNPLTIYLIELCLSDIVRDGERYRLEITERKTGKSRIFTVPLALYQLFGVTVSTMMFPPTR